MKKMRSNQTYFEEADDERNKLLQRPKEIGRCE